MATEQQIHPMPVIQQPGQQQQATTVIVNQVVQSAKIRNWRTGLFSCFDDIGICLCVQCCPCYSMIKITQDMGENMCLPCCVPNFMIPLRTRLRTQLDIHGSICDDCMVTTCCPQCALCQLMREHKMAQQAGEL